LAKAQLLAVTNLNANTGPAATKQHYRVNHRLHRQVAAIIRVAKISTYTFLTITNKTNTSTFQATMATATEFIVCKAGKKLVLVLLNIIYY
jgi:hypothetical protein